MLQKMIPVRRLISSTSITVACSFLSFVTGAQADEPKTESCIAANENAQTLRRDGRLQAARRELLMCVVPGCPTIIRDDCAERLDEVDRAMPTILFSATGAAHADLTAVVVTMDGNPLVDRLGGSPVGVDPGEHTFAFAADGYAAIERKLLLREGVKNRQELLAFVVSTPVPVVDSVPIAVPKDATPIATGNRQRTLAYVVGGVGLVGLGLGTFLGLHAKATYDDASSLAHCKAGPSSCDAIGVAKGEDAHAQGNVATAAFIAGGALVVGGIFLAITAPKAGGVSVRPTAGAGGAGLRIGRTW